MDRKVMLTADSTCDLNKELMQRYHVKTYPLHIVLGGKSFEDSVNIMPDEIYDNFIKQGSCRRLRQSTQGNISTPFALLSSRGMKSYISISVALCQARTRTA